MLGMTSFGFQRYFGAHAFAAEGLFAGHRKRLTPLMTDYAYEFQHESRRIDQLIWDAMSLVSGERVLFCGFANDGLWVKRAVEIGVDVTVIESDAKKLAELQALGIATLRGSTTLIPARDASYDAIVAFHYLHEIDPTFHTQIVWELARVGKRIIIVEPAPPSDPLGKRISELYSRAKYEAGSFEEYRSIDYWRKLLAMVKADVLMQQFTFTRLAPRSAVEETVGLILDAMEIEQMPESYLAELRELARSPEAQLSPLSRFVLVALGAGEPLRASAGTLFRESDAPDDQAEEREYRRIAASVAATLLVPQAPPPSYASSLEGAEFPSVLPPAAPPPQPQQAPQQPQQQPAAAAKPPAPPVPEPAFGLAEPAPFGMPAPGGRTAPLATPFGLPDDPDPFGLSPDPEERAGFGWTWEPPAGHPEAQPGDEPFGR